MSNEVNNIQEFSHSHTKRVYSNQIKSTNLKVKSLQLFVLYQLKYLIVFYQKHNL